MFGYCFAGARACEGPLWTVPLQTLFLLNLIEPANLGNWHAVWEGVGLEVIRAAYTLGTLSIEGRPQFAMQNYYFPAV